MTEDGFSDYSGIIMMVFVTVVFVGVLGYLQWTPLTPIANFYGTNVTDTITVSGKVFDANNDWYEIITTDNVKYLTEPRTLSESVEVNHTYSVVIQKTQTKLNMRGGIWSNKTYITSLKEVTDGTH